MIWLGLGSELSLHSSYIFLTDQVTLGLFPFCYWSLEGDVPSFHRLLLTSDVTSLSLPSVPTHPERPYLCPVCAIHLCSGILRSWVSVSTMSRTGSVFGELKAEGKASNVLSDGGRGLWGQSDWGGWGGVHPVSVSFTM